jgi:hypothetical protein
MAHVSSWAPHMPQIMRSTVGEELQERVASLLDSSMLKKKGKGQRTSFFHGPLSEREGPALFL